MKLKKMKAPALKTELEHCLQQLDTQTRVARQIEHERDKANDELEFCKVCCLFAIYIAYIAFVIMMYIIIDAISSKSFKL